jgi:hypothetical protein
MTTRRIQCGITINKPPTTTNLTLKDLKVGDVVSLPADHIKYIVLSIISYSSNLVVVVGWKDDNNGLRSDYWTNTSILYTVHNLKLLDVTFRLGTPS